MYWLTGILGLALILAPSILGYGANATANWTSIILGAVVVVVSVVKALAKDVGKWEYWVAGIAGVLTVIAPFVLGFSAHATALRTSIILGAVVAILAGYQVFGQPQTK
ncbi:MAG: SPW repeat protein [Chloroflexi bacterium]|nr:SPW repeat protein [Chloroflexota bacterium]